MHIASCCSWLETNANVRRWWWHNFVIIVLIAQFIVPMMMKRRCEHKQRGPALPLNNALERTVEKQIVEAAHSIRQLGIRQLGKGNFAKRGKSRSYATQQQEAEKVQFWSKKFQFSPETSEKKREPQEHCLRESFFSAFCCCF